MTKKHVVFLALIATTLATAPVHAMHIAEGYLPPSWAGIWAVVALPFFLYGFKSVKKQIALDPKKLSLLALCGAYAFLLSALKLPSVTGSCSHPTGVGLGAIIFGPSVMALISFIVLLFQALLLAHGGLTTLGANLFSMGIAGPFVSYGIYKLLKKFNSKTSIAVFFAAFLGDVFTYCVTSIQLALAYPSQGSIVNSSIKFLSVFAVTQLPLAVVEGLVTVVIFSVLEKYFSTSLDYSVLKSEV